MGEKDGGETGVAGDADLLDEFGDMGGNRVAFRELGIDEKTLLPRSRFEGGH
jgi:hypothetical protein